MEGSQQRDLKCESISFTTFMESAQTFSAGQSAMQYTKEDLKVAFFKHRLSSQYGTFEF